MRPEHYFPVTLLIYAAILNLQNSVEAKPKPKSKCSKSLQISLIVKKVTTLWTKDSIGISDLPLIRLILPYKISCTY